jgi:ABC-type dipeptide/oligopeptide/nickel transport system permease subunit
VSAIEKTSDVPEPSVGSAPATVAFATRPTGVVRQLLKHPAAVISILVLLTTVVLAIVVPIISPFQYDIPTDLLLQKPSALHLLGTDDTGYDIGVRLAVGARLSLFVGIGVELIVVVVGTLVGLLAGYYGGWADTLLMRFTDMMFAFPDILLAILIMAVRGPGLANVFAALAVTGWPGLARLVRAQTLSLRDREFIEASRVVGASDASIIRRHILPNLLTVIVVASTLDIAGVIISEATLSFLGIGEQPPMPSWGLMISNAYESGYWRDNPQLVFYPAICLVLTVLAFNFLGDALRDVLDPRGNKSR